MATTSSSTTATHVSVSESSDSEQPTASSDLSSTASSSLPGTVKHIFEDNLTIFMSINGTFHEQCSIA